MCSVLRVSCKKMTKSRRSRSCCSYSSLRKKDVKKVHRSRSVTKNVPVRTFSTLIEFLCSAFQCSPHHLETVIPANLSFVQRLLRNNFPPNGFLLRGTSARQFFGLRRISEARPSSWRPLKYPNLPMVILRHVTNAGTVHLSALPLEFFYMSNVVRC